MMIKRQKYWLIVGVLALSAISINAFIISKSSEEQALNESKKAAEELAPKAPLHATKHQVPKDTSIITALLDAKVPTKTAYAVVEASKSNGGLDRIPAGMNFVVEWQDESETIPAVIKFHFSPRKKLYVQKDDNGEWHSQSFELPITSHPVTFTGVVESNLWASAEKAGMDPRLIGELATVFAWQIDFSREVRKFDQWRLVVERQLVENEGYGWGNILVAEYENAGDLYTAIRYPQEGPDASYYMPDGSSLKRLFLKSPIKFARISSRFKAQRFHPLLQKNMPHNGVDYAAHPGTPIMSVGNGRVEFAGENGTSGIMVRIRHNSTYQTAYMHMQAIAKGISRGEKVKQGQVLGYVGQTGRASGPHLHFAFYENSKFVDPLGRKFPSQDPIPENTIKTFNKIVQTALKLLPDWKVADAVKDQNKPSSI